MSTFAGTRFGSPTTDPTVANNPNMAPGTATSPMPFTVQTSYIEQLYKGGSGFIANDLNAGQGSLVMRDVATDIVLYKPFDFVVDTLNQLMSKYRTTDKVAVEWYAEDMLNPAEANGVSGLSGALGINGSGVYTPEPAGRQYKVAEGLSDYFRIDDKVRYAKADGTWQLAVVTDINGTTDVLTLASLDGGNLPAAASATARIERVGSIRNMERNILPRPRGSFGKMDFTYVENFSHEIAFSRFAKTMENYVDIYSRSQEKLFHDFRLNRATNAYYGIRGKRLVTYTDPSTGAEVKDWAYSSPGIWDMVYNYSRQESDFTTGGSFDANKFKNAINRFVEFNFGAESGGPQLRQNLMNAKFASYLSQAYEDKQRFYTEQYVAGIRCNRFENNLGVLDFMMDPMLEYRAPVPGASLKEGSGLAVNLLVPFEECVTRVQMTGQGPRQEEFQLHGGDRDKFLRVEAIEGTQMANLQYCSALIEVAKNSD